MTIDKDVVKSRFRPLIAVIDPALMDPATICFNEIVSAFPECGFTVHHPGLFAVPSLKSPSAYQGIIILGSAAFVTEPQPWMEDVVTFTMAALKCGIPVLGCCFGHQLIAQALGATVDYVTPDKEKLSGVREIRFDAPFLDFAADMVTTLAVTHRQEIKKLPKTFEVTASSAKIVYEAIRHRELPFWGVQGHPEASRFFMTEYLSGLLDADIAQAVAGGTQVIAGFLKQIHIWSEL